MAKKKIPMIILMGAQFALLEKILAIWNDQVVTAERKGRKYCFENSMAVTGALMSAEDKERSVIVMG